MFGPPSRTSQTRSMTKALIGLPFVVIRRRSYTRLGCCIAMPRENPIIPPNANEHCTTEPSGGSRLGHSSSTDHHRCVLRQQHCFSDKVSLAPGAGMMLIGGDCLDSRSLASRASIPAGRAAPGDVGSGLLPVAGRVRFCTTSESKRLPRRGTCEVTSILCRSISTAIVASTPPAKMS